MSCSPPTHGSLPPPVVCGRHTGAKPYSNLVPIAPPAAKLDNTNNTTAMLLLDVEACPSEHVSIRQLSSSGATKQAPSRELQGTTPTGTLFGPLAGGAVLSGISIYHSCSRTNEGAWPSPATGTAQTLAPRGTHHLKIDHYRTGGDSLPNITEEEPCLGGGTSSLNELIDAGHSPQLLDRTGMMRGVLVPSYPSICTSRCFCP